MEKERAVVYARVSTNQDQQKSSLESQKEYYTKYAKEKGYEFVKLYYDEGLTGTNPKRKQFLQMLEDAGLDVTEKKHSRILDFDTSDREPLFDWIILKDVSRFARNTDATSIVKRLREKGVYIIFENMGFTTKDSDWEFRFGLMITFAQQESIDRSMKGKKAYQLKYEKEQFHMSNVLLGYVKNKKTGKYDIVEDEAEIVRFVFDQYVNHNLGSTEIAKLCNEKGYKSKRGKSFTPNMVLKIIRNEKYKGLVIVNKETFTDITGSHKRIKQPKEKWIPIHDALPAIVSPELFDKAQEVRSKRVQIKDNTGVRGRKLSKNPFHNKIFCGKCHTDFVRTSVKKTRNGKKVTEYFYSCRNKRYKIVGQKPCDNGGLAHNVLVRELTNIGDNLHDKFNGIRIHEEKMALDDIMNKLNDKIKNAETEKDNIRKQIVELDRQIENITNSIALGVDIDVNKILRDKIKEIKLEKIKLETSILDYNTVEIEKEKQYYIDEYKKIEKFSKKKTFSYDDVVDLIHKIHVLPFREVLVELKTPTLLLDSEIYKGETDYALLPFAFALRGKK